MIDCVTKSYLDTYGSWNDENNQLANLDQLTSACTCRR